MKIKVQFACRKDNYQTKYIAEIYSGNIFVDDNNILPGCTDKILNFISDYNQTYNKVSKGRVNTRFLYPYSRNYKAAGTEGRNEIFAYLNWWKRQKLSIITKKTFIHKHPIATITLIINILGFIPLWIPFLFPNNTPDNQRRVPTKIYDTKITHDSVSVPDSSLIVKKNPTKKQ